jgi:nucleotide-binding universal stress UspA family protein
MSSTHDLPVVALCDPTPASTNAAWRAALVARELGAPLLLLHADRDGVRAQAIGQLLAGLAGRIRDRIGIDVATEVVSDDPLRAATHASREARMLVLGLRRNNALRDWVLGTQAERLIRLSRAPVLVVKRDATAAYRRLLVPIDFGGGGPVAAAMAVALSRAPQLEIFHALDSRADVSLRASGVADAVLEDRRRHALQGARHRLMQLADAVGGAARGAVPGVAFGPPAEMVVARAHAMRADLVVMGKRPRGAIADFLLGSVTQRVLAQARTDVLVVAVQAMLPAGPQQAHRHEPDPLYQRPDFRRP